MYEDDRPAVPVAAVYGANASGKSTLVDAFRFFTDEKSAGNGASELYPLSDFKPRKGENFERRYLAGSYGAVPLLPETAFEDLLKKYWGAHGEVVPA
ncbi:AAA family ATPase [Streptomyces sp. NPDC051569]|uniref:AAA family ATPase n=1 Tax=Streptomyces sp. NPDC051569 TaxID=3365661 RepID=UPI00379EC835